MGNAVDQRALLARAAGKPAPFKAKRVRPLRWCRMPDCKPWSSIWRLEAARSVVSQSVVAPVGAPLSSASCLFASYILLGSWSRLPCTARKGLCRFGPKNTWICCWLGSSRSHWFSCLGGTVVGWQLTYTLLQTLWTKSSSWLRVGTWPGGQFSVCCGGFLFHLWSWHLSARRHNARR